jgi:hypothetical protein
MKLKPGDTVRVVGFAWHGESSGDPEGEARSVGGLNAAATDSRRTSSIVANLLMLKKTNRRDFWSGVLAALATCSDLDN